MVLATTPFPSLDSGKLDPVTLGALVSVQLACEQHPNRAASSALQLSELW